MDKRLSNPLKVTEQVAGSTLGARQLGSQACALYYYIICCLEVDGDISISQKRKLRNRG
jgi:hypothetical protein